MGVVNHERNPENYIKTFPYTHVGEIHLGGHAPDKDDLGNPLLIDAHDREVIDEVWALYEQAISLGGSKPTLIEWDNDLPSWPILVAEALKARCIIDNVFYAHEDSVHVA